MTKNYIIYAALFFAAVFSITSCSKMNDLHDVYLERGETIFVSRLDTASIQSGKNRVAIKYLNKDPKVAKLLVYWGGRKDSILVDIPANSLNDTLTVLINNLAEDNHTFELVTMNKESKFRSIAYELSVNVYGDRFSGSLLDRAVKSKEFVVAKNQLKVEWLRAPQYAVATDISYTTVSGQKVTRRVKASESSTSFSDVAGSIEYRTLFIPVKTAIDTVYTSFKPLNPIVVEGVELDKTKFRRWNPTGIPYTGNTTTTWRIENAWNNTLATGFANNTYEFTFDMGQVAKLSQLVINSRKETNLIFNSAHARKFQIWGSASANVNASFTGWTLLGEFESLKPSGSPVGTVTPEDIEYAHTDGEKYYFPSVSPDIRYIRFVAQETWGKVVGVQFMELTFTGVIK